MPDWQQVSLAALLPHAPPMVLLDRVVAFDGLRLVAEVTISEASRFYEPALAGVPAWISIEYMAQAIAALGGLHARERQQAPRVGFLLGTRRLALHSKVLQAGQTYQVVVQQAFQAASGLANFTCQVLRDEHLCVEAAVNIFVPPDTAAGKEESP